MHQISLGGRSTHGPSQLQAPQIGFAMDFAAYVKFSSSSSGILVLLLTFVAVLATLLHYA